LELESFYSITTFIGDMSPPPQIRQVAQLPEHYMQPARIKPDAKEHTNNPVQRPNFRGQNKGTPTNYQSRGLRKSTREDRKGEEPEVAVLPRCVRAIKPMGEGVWRF
jgi:hypothetical protein